METLTYLFLIFIFYSFIGYIVEMIYMTIQVGRINNRGFLTGPVLPVYGIGSIFIILTLSKYKQDPVALFFLSAILCSALEYVTSFLLEKIFHNMWWDYFDMKFNLNGRICLLNTVLFGIGGIIIILIGQPILSKVIELLEFKTWLIVAIIIFIIFIIDTIYSIIVAYNLRNRLIIVEEVKNEKLSKIPLVLERTIKKRVANLKIYPTRLIKAFPRLTKGKFKEFKIMKKLSLKKKEEK